MTLAAFVSNFADLTGWTNSGVTAASNLLKASSGGTRGTCYRDHGVSNSTGRLAFDLIPDTTDTAGRYVWVGQFATGANLDDYGVAYVAGTGIVATLYYGTPSSASWTIVVADELITTGRRYHCELFFKQEFGGTAASVLAQVYDMSDTITPAKFVGGGSKAAAVGGSGWYTFARIGVITNSAVSSVSRVAWEPGVVPSATTEQYLQGTCLAIVPTGDSQTSYMQAAGALIPGAIRATGTNEAAIDKVPIVALVFHGAGSYDRTWIAQGGSGMYYNRSQAALPPHPLVWALSNAGIPCYAPGGYTSVGAGVTHWGSNAAYNEARWLMGYLRTLYGTNTKFILVGYSMGGLLAHRLIAQGEESGIIAGVFLHGVTGLYNAWANASWTAQVETAWGVSGLNETTAHALFDAYDPLVLAAAHPERYQGKVLYFLTRALDTTVVSASHTAALTTILAAASVKYHAQDMAWGIHTPALEPNIVQQIVSECVPGPDVSSVIDQVLTYVVNADLNTPDNFADLAIDAGAGTVRALDASGAALGTHSDVVSVAVDVIDALPSEPLTAQQIRDAMKLAPSAGAAAAGSIDTLLADVPTTAEMEDRTLAAASYATAANQTTLLNRIGAWTGTGVNTILGAFKALLSKAASAPSDIGGTFAPSTDSTEGLRDTLPTAVSAVYSGSITVSAPVIDGGDIEIYQYDDYRTAQSRYLSWTNSGGDWTGGDLTDATVTFVARTLDDVAVLSKAGSVITATGTQKVAVELTSANSGLFTLKGKAYKYQLLLTKSTYRETAASGLITVTPTFSAPSS